MTDFKDDRAAFEAATPGEWEQDGDNVNDGEASLIIMFNGRAEFTETADATLIVRMHSTYLARMERIEELRARLVLMTELASLAMVHADHTYLRRSHEEGSAGE